MREATKAAERAAQQAARYREGVLDALHESGRPWMTHRQIADATPWSLGTVSYYLLRLLPTGMVETRFELGRRQWRLR